MSQWEGCSPDHTPLPRHKCHREGQDCQHKRLCITGTACGSKLTITNPQSPHERPANRTGQPIIYIWGIKDIQLFSCQKSRSSTVVLVKISSTHPPWNVSLTVVTITHGDDHTLFPPSLPPTRTTELMVSVELPDFSASTTSGPRSFPFHPRNPWNSEWKTNTWS